MPRRRKPEARPNAHIASTVILPRLSEDELYERVETLEEDPFLLVLDGVQDPHNLGACLRSAEAAGCQAVIAPRDRAVGVTETARRVSVGAADLIPFVQVTNIGRCLEQLKERGVWIVGTGDEEAQLIYEVDLKGPLALAMGAEGKGIRLKTASQCDHLVRIPMLGETECLNVSVATGVCLFEAVRQRLA